MKTGICLRYLYIYSGDASMLLVTLSDGIYVAPLL